MKNVENNKLIAKFMGLKIISEEDFLIYNYPKGTDIKTLTVDVSLSYHTSWNWLMEVVEKIEEITISDENLTTQEHRFLVEMPLTQCEIYDQVQNKVVGSGDCGNKLKSTYQAVVEFIKWYNKNKEQ